MCAGCSTFEEQAPISVKGVEQPMRSWLIERPCRGRRAGAARRRRRGHARWSGARPSCSCCATACERAVAERRLRARSPSSARPDWARAGCWPSSSSSLDRQACWLLLGRAHPRSALQPFGLLRDMLYRQLQIAEGEDAAAARDKLVARAGAAVRGRRRSPGAPAGPVDRAGLLGQPACGRTAGRRAEVPRCRPSRRARCTLRRLGDTRPVVVVVLDDLHWADEGSLEFMRFVLQRDARRAAAEPDADAADDVRAARRLDARRCRATRGST